MTITEGPGRHGYETFAKAKVLITGGAGFIGSHLARRLVALGAELIIVDSLVPEFGGNLHNIAGLEGQVRVNISDIRDVRSLRYLIKDRQFIFNLAGQTSHVDSMKDPFNDLEINCHAQLALLEACRTINPDVTVLFASTRQVYGRPDYLPVDEKHPLNPVDVNGINKIAGESYHKLYNDVYGIKTCVLRLTNVYGAGMRISDARQTFVGVWIRNLMEGKPFEVWGGRQIRDFTHVDDVVDAFLAAAVTPATRGRALNVGGYAPLSLLEFADLLIAANGGRGSYAVKAFPAERAAIDIGDYYTDDRLFRDLTSWRPAGTLMESLKQTIEFYRENYSHYV